MKKCKATTNKGTPCTRDATRGDYCYQHDSPAEDAEPGLTPKEASFVEEWPVDLNGTQAAIRAGYSPNGASVQASRLLAKPKIQAAIKKRLEEKAAPADEVLARLTTWMRGSVASFFTVDEDEDGNRSFRLDLTSEEARSNFHLIKKISYNALGLPVIEINDPMAAAVHLGRAHALFKDVQQVKNLNPEADLSDEELDKEIERLEAVAKGRG